MFPPRALEFSVKLSTFLLVWSISTSRWIIPALDDSRAGLLCRWITRHVCVVSVRELHVDVIVAIFGSVISENYVQKCQ